MRASRSTFAVGLLLSVALPAGAALASDPGEQIMLERAGYWRAQHRLDLAGDILNKLLAANPSQPDALYQKGLLAMEQGDRGGAQQYLDRLRQVAAADKRAAELLAASAPAPATSAPAASAPAAPVKPVAVTVAPPATTAPVAKAAAVSRPAPELVVASADSDDLMPARPVSPPSVPAGPATHLAAVAPVVPAQLRQVASLTPITLTDADTPLPVTAAPSAGSNDRGISAKMVQVAQVELEPPLPVGGYQSLPGLKPYSPTDTLETDIERDLTRLESQSNPTLTAGFGFRGHTGTDGLGLLQEFGVPVELSFSPWYTGTARIDILPVYLEAGSPGGGHINIFGANPLPTAAAVPVVAPGDQNASGVGLLGSYALGDFSGQIGTTPLGFPVTNIVGDIAYVPKFWGDTLSVRIEGQRQPVTDSVLSYAGTRANFSTANIVAPGAFGTNTLWGGVVRTGPHITAFYDDQMYGAYAGAGVAWLTGTNVAQNSVVDALLGAYFRPWKTDNWTLRVGVSLYYTGYDKNLNGFSFGQGGYFSPQDFEGLGFPIEWTGHAGPWSWLASTTLGVQHFNQKSTPVFPNNPNAQLALETLSPTTAFDSGGHSTGFGFNLKGQIEYAIDPTLSVGAAGSFDNGNAYDEVIAKVYLRKTFDWFAPVAVKDDPRSIVARDQPMSRL